MRMAGWPTRRAGALIVLLILVAAACGGGEETAAQAGPDAGGGTGAGGPAQQPAPAGPSPIDGDYYGGTSVLRLDEGTWTFVSGKNIRWTGVASVTDGELAISGEESCPETGTYAWTLAGETLALESIQEECPGRNVLLSKEWQAISSLESVDEDPPTGTLVTLPDLRFTGYWGRLDVAGRSTAEIEVFIREGYHEGGWAFSPTVLVGEPGQRLELTVRNPTGTKIYPAQHNFTLEEQGISVDIDPGEEAVVTVVFPDSGSLTFYCRRHVDEGQAGLLTVA